MIRSTTPRSVGSASEHETPHGERPTEVRREDSSAVARNPELGPGMTGKPLADASRRLRGLRRGSRRSSAELDALARKVAEESAREPREDAGERGVDTTTPEAREDLAAFIGLTRVTLRRLVRSARKDLGSPDAYIRHQARVFLRDLARDLLIPREKGSKAEPLPSTKPAPFVTRKPAP